MECTAEFPDAHVANLAQQFLDTASLLRARIPSVVAPSALRVNAAFAIELFLKSLNSHWKQHKIDDLGFDNEYEITTESNVRGHLLDRLYDQLPDTVRTKLNDAFASHPLSKKFNTLRDILFVYANTFAIERYGFEQRTIDTDYRPIVEIVSLAEFLGDFVRNMPRVRYALT